jgi:hypothetical protein
VDARPFKGETRVYVGDALGGRIAVLDPDRNIWYMIALLHIQNYGSAVIQDYRRPEIYQDVPAECIAVSKLQSSVYLTSKRSHDLYTASFKDLRNLTSYVTPNVKVYAPDRLIIKPVHTTCAMTEKCALCGRMGFVGGRITFVVF